MDTAGDPPLSKKPRNVATNGIMIVVCPAKAAAALKSPVITVSPSDIANALHAIHTDSPGVATKRSFAIAFELVTVRIVL